MPKKKKMKVKRFTIDLCDEATKRLASLVMQSHSGSKSDLVRRLIFAIGDATMSDQIIIRKPGGSQKVVLVI